jgi:hypothetical protein
VCHRPCFAILRDDARRQRTKQNKKKRGQNKKEKHKREVIVVKETERPGR